MVWIFSLIYYIPDYINFSKNALQNTNEVILDRILLEQTGKSLVTFSVPDSVENPSGILLSQMRNDPVMKSLRKAQTSNLSVYRLQFHLHIKISITVTLANSECIIRSTCVSTCMLHVLFRAIQFWFWPELKNLRAIAFRFD